MIYFCRPNIEMKQRKYLVIVKVKVQVTCVDLYSAYSYETSKAPRYRSHSYTMPAFTS